MIEMNGQRFLTEQEVADALRVCKSTVRNLRNRGDLGFHIFGKRRVLISEMQLREFIQQQERPAKSAA